MSTQTDKDIYHLLELKFGLIGHSMAMKEVISGLVKAAPTDLSVLITGDTGTGKEVFANAIHGLSNRKKFHFVTVNCGAIPETLLESELFGHERGAFTGATDSRKGYFEVADKGTIFLDEIGEMPIGTQVKLLRVLELGEFTRLGSTLLKKVDVRIVAATNRNIELEVRAGNFRQDLFFRLKNVQIQLPPLIEHLEDLPVLVEYFAKRICDKLMLKYDGISTDAINILKSLPWPGNIRELKNMIETLVTLEQATYITPEILKRYIPHALPAPEYSPISKETSIQHYNEINDPKKLELELIFRTLLEIRHDLNDLKISNRNILEKVDKINVNMLDMQPNDLENYDEPEQKVIRNEALKLEDLEKQLIIYSLKKFDGNRRLAANALGISERTLYRKINEFDLDH